MRRSLAIAIALAVALTGCAEGEEREVKEVADVFVELVAQDQRDVACQLFADYDGKRCSFEQEFDLEQLDYREGTAVDDVEVAGDRAVVTLVNEGFLSGYECCDPEPIELERVDGRWRITSTIAP